MRTGRRGDGIVLEFSDGWVAIGPTVPHSGKITTKLRAVAVVAMLVALTAGCAEQPHRITVEPPSVPKPLVERIPLTIGVHYTPEFRAAQPISKLALSSAANTIAWSIGEPSVRLFNDAVRQLFVTVVEIERWPASQAIPTVSGVLVPSVEGVHAWASPGTAPVAVDYRLELYASDGEKVGAWNVRGESDSGRTFLSFGTKTADAMRFAAAGVVASFFREPVARMWLEKNGVDPDRLR